MGLWIFVLTRFLDANRYPLRLENALMQLLVFRLARWDRGHVVTADQPHELLRMHLVAVIAGILMRHRPRLRVAQFCARLLRRCPVMV